MVAKRVQLVHDHAAQAGEELAPRRDSDSSSASDSGVVSSKSGGRSRWRSRRLCGVSPVRVSARTGSAISATGSSDCGAMSVASAFKRRDVERVQLALALLVREILAVAAALRELDQGRQEARQRLAAAGRRDQQRALALLRQLDQGELVRPWRPAATFEPA